MDSSSDGKIALSHCVNTMPLSEVAKLRNILVEIRVHQEDQVWQLFRHMVCVSILTWGEILDEVWEHEDWLLVLQAFAL